jgi:hypothetical protein
LTQKHHPQFAVLMIWSFVIFVLAGNWIESFLISSAAAAAAAAVTDKLLRAKKK